jgi:hypothetical protein
MIGRLPLTAAVGERVRKMLVVALIGGLLLVGLALACGAVECRCQGDAWTRIAQQRRELAAWSDDLCSREADLALATRQMGSRLEREADPRAEGRCPNCRSRLP